MNITYHYCINPIHASQLIQYVFTVCLLYLLIFMNDVGEELSLTILFVIYLLFRYNLLCVIRENIHHVNFRKP